MVLESSERGSREKPHPLHDNITPKNYSFYLAQLFSRLWVSAAMICITLCVRTIPRDVRPERTKGKTVLLIVQA